MSSHQELGSLLDQANEMMFGTRYEQAANLLAQFLETADDTLTPADRFHVRGIRCFCLYHNRDYELARDTVTQLLQEREREGVLDLNYLYEVKVLALAQRGLCRFEECLGWLAAVLKQLKEIKDPPSQVTNLISEIDQQIETTHNIKNDELVQALTIHQIELHGLFGTETLGVQDLEIPRDQMALHCRVHRCAVFLQDFNRLRLDLEFSLNNQREVESWPLRSEDATPLLFALAFPRGGKVHHGDFEMHLSSEGVEFPNEGVSLENHYFTIIHPASYHPRSREPIPVCKTFRYIKADCSVFWSPLPPVARIRFSGWIDFAQYPGDCREGTIARKLWLLLPYGQARLPRPEFHAVVADDFEFVKGAVARVAFRRDQTGFRAGEYIVEGPGPEPILGAASPADETETEDDLLNLEDLDMLAVEATMIPRKALLATLRPLADVVPLGTFNDLPLLHARKDPTSDGPSTFDLRGEARELSVEERRPLTTVLLENYSAEARSLELAVECEPLGLRSEVVADIAPWERMAVPIKPRLDQSPPIFSGWQSSADLPQEIRTCPISLSVRERGQEGHQGSMELISKISQTRVLPPDFMVWSISEPSDGRLVDLRLLVARWVTPRATAVVKLLEESGLRRPTGNPGEDMGRIYHRIAARKIQYDMSRISFGAEMAYRFQRIRTPTVILASRRMNCIDGCVLFASCMEALGYSPIIVFLPRHAIFATILSGTLDAIESLLILETTMACAQGDQEPFAYEEALAAGTSQFAENEKYLVPSDAEEKPRRGFWPGFPLDRIVPLEWARKYGVEPFEDR